MPNHYQLSQDYARQQHQTNARFLAKQQAKAVKNQQRDRQASTDELTILHLILNYQAFSDGTCGVSGSFNADKPLPRLATGDKIGCSAVEYETGSSSLAPEVLGSSQRFRTFCQGSDPKLFNAMVERTAKFMAREVRLNNPDIARGLEAIDQAKLSFNCRGSWQRNFTNGAKPRKELSNFAIGGISFAVSSVFCTVLILGLWLLRCRQQRAQHLQADIDYIRSESFQTSL